MREFQNGITYTQIVTFRAIFEAGNISKAAKKLGISPASVSYSLKLLESLVGEPLFTRTTRAIMPTKLGVQLYQSSRLAIDNLSNAVEVICEQNSRPVGTLALNMAKNIYDVFLKEILIDFAREYPNLQLEITLSDAMDERTETTIDIGFRFGETVNESLIARAISPYFKTVKLALFASPTYVEKHGAPTSIEELKDCSLIQFRAPTSGQVLPIRIHSLADPSSEVISFSNLPSSIVVNNTDVIIDMACNDLGIGYLMDVMVQNKLDSGELLPLLKGHWCNLPTVYMYYSTENRKTLRVQCFLDFLKKRLAIN